VAIAIAPVVVIMSTIVSVSVIFVATMLPTTAHGGHVDFLAQVMNRQHFHVSWSG
jgi:hypothetical protein